MSLEWTTIEDAIATWVQSATGLVAWWSRQKGPRPATSYVEIRPVRIKTLGQDWTRNENRTLVLADDVVESVSAAANTLTLTAHAYLTGDGPVRIGSTGTLPAGLLPGTDYWIIKVDANTIKLASSFQRAIATVPTPIDITDAGTGTHTISDTADTVRAGQEIDRKTQGHRLVTLSMTCFAGLAGDAHGVDMPDSMLEKIALAGRSPARKRALNAAGVGLSKCGDVMSIPGALGVSEFEARATMEVRFFASSEVVESATFVEFVEVTNEITDPDQTFYVPEDPPV